MKQMKNIEVDEQEMSAETILKMADTQNLKSSLDAMLVAYLLTTDNSNDKISIYMDACTLLKALNALENE